MQQSAGPRCVGSKKYVIHMYIEPFISNPLMFEIIHLGLHAVE